MKNIFLLILLVSIISCKSSDLSSSVKQDYKIWEITNYTSNNIEFFTDIISKGFVVHNMESGKTYINFQLSDEAVTKLENQWKKHNKKLVIDKISIIQEVSYNQTDSELQIDDIKIDFVITGENTQKIVSKINNVIYTERTGESPGLISLIYQIWNPTIVDQIPKMELTQGDKLLLSFENDLIVLSDNNKTIKLKDNGIHQWIGY